MTDDRTPAEVMADWYDSDPEREQKEKEAKRGLRKSPKP